MKKIDKRSLTSRQNAKKSTGPKTNPGKRASCLNAVTHAAYADTLILPGENLEDNQRLVRNHFQMWKPQNPIEERKNGKTKLFSAQPAFNPTHSASNPTQTEVSTTAENPDSLLHLVANIVSST